jgi:Fe-S-cluster-containing dehydrogenase component
MDKKRRDFLKIAGLSALGFGVKPVSHALAADKPAKHDKPNASQYEKPLVGKRWAMIINLKKFKESGKAALDACIKACHSIHNVPHFPNKKDEVKWIYTEPIEHVLPNTEHLYLEEFVHESLKGMPVLALCNHCDNPPCVRVCPTQATFRRKDGIVQMDFHRCIGCRYCMAACPFGARSLNWRDPRPFIEKLNPEFPTRTRGVVEKCNFCAERLAKGEIPACVAACKNGEMVFGDMEDPESEVRKILKENFAIRRKPQLGTRPQVYYIV